MARPIHTRRRVAGSTRYKRERRADRRQSLVEAITDLRLSRGQLTSLLGIRGRQLDSVLACGPYRDDLLEYLERRVAHLEYNEAYNGNGKES